MKECEMAFKVKRLDGGVPHGVIVTALDPTDIAAPEVRKALHDLWIEEGLIIFRDIAGGEATQIELSRVFGEPVQHPLSDPKRQDRVSELADVFYRPDEGDIVEVRGERKGGYLPWHFDLVYLPRINHGGILRAITRAPHGGETAFLDGIDLYDRLPAALKAKIEGLDVTYFFDPDMNHQRYGKEPGFRHDRIATRTQEAFDRMKLPPGAHPLVYTQPETGRKILNLSPWYATGIDGMAQDEADAILEEVAPYCTDNDRAYFHKWEGDEMVLWDNWRMLHYAAGVSGDQVRHVQRTTIHGDYALGRTVMGERAEQTA
jgi:taurine dioxygenase